MSDVLVEKLRAMSGLGGGWVGEVRSGDALEVGGVVQCLIDSGVCRTDYAALSIAGNVGRDVGFDIVCQSGKFTKRARASLDKWVSEYADGDGDTGGYAFSHFRNLLAAYVGSVPVAGWSRAYGVVNSVTAMQLGGQWSLHDHCWFREYKNSWVDVNAVGGFVIKGLWVYNSVASFVAGDHGLERGGAGDNKTIEWAGLYSAGGATDRNGVRLIVVPLRGGGVWCFNFYRKNVRADWDNGVDYRGDYSDRALDGGLDVMRRDLLDLAGNGYQMRAVQGTSGHAFINGASSFVVVPRSSLLYAQGDYVNGITAVCDVLGAGVGVDDVRVLDYNATLTDIGDALIYTPRCAGCGSRSCEGCCDDDEGGDND